MVKFHSHKIWLTYSMTRRQPSPSLPSALSLCPSRGGLKLRKHLEMFKSFYCFILLALTAFLVSFVLRYVSIPVYWLETGEFIEIAPLTDSLRGVCFKICICYRFYGCESLIVKLKIIKKVKALKRKNGSLNNLKWKLNFNRYNWIVA